MREINITYLILCWLAIVLLSVEVILQEEDENQELVDECEFTVCTNESVSLAITHPNYTLEIVDDDFLSIEGNGNVCFWDSDYFTCQEKDTGRVFRADEDLNEINMTKYNQNDK